MEKVAASGGCGGGGGGGATVNDRKIESRWWSRAVLARSGKLGTRRQHPQRVNDDKNDHHKAQKNISGRAQRRRFEEADAPIAHDVFIVCVEASHVVAFHGSSLTKLRTLKDVVILLGASHL